MERRKRLMRVKVIYCIDNKQAYDSIARLQDPVQVVLLPSAPGQSSSQHAYAKVTLKTCLSTICISRPELVTDPSIDYAVSALDPYESSQAVASTSSEPYNYAPGQGLTEGKGMLSWNLAEKKQGTTWICGRVMRRHGAGLAAGDREPTKKKRRLEDGLTETEADDDDDEEEEEHDTLEVWLQLQERPSFTQTQFMTSLRSFAHPPPATTADMAALGDGDPVKAPQPAADAAAWVAQQAQQVFPPVGASSSSSIPIATDSSSLSTTSAPGPAPAEGISSLLESLQQFTASAAAATAAGTSIPLPEEEAASRLLSAFQQQLPLMAAMDPSKVQAILPMLMTLSKFVSPSTTTTPVLQQQEGSFGFGGGAAAAAPMSEQPQMPYSDIDFSSAPAAGPSTTTMGTEPTSMALTVRGQGGAPLKRGRKPTPQTFRAIMSTDKENELLPPAAGCGNCQRKRTATWRCGTATAAGRTDMQIVCNACGIFYNKHNRHRTKEDRVTTSPVRVNGIGATFGHAPSRSLQARLSAVCEADLRSQHEKHEARKRLASGGGIELSHKKKRKRVFSSAGGASVPGLIPPPSPSKRIGRTSPTRSPALGMFPWAFNGTAGAAAKGAGLTSPCRSPMRAFGAFGSAGTKFGQGGALTSPFGAKKHAMGQQQSQQQQGSANGLGIKSATGHNEEGGDENKAADDSFDFTMLFRADSPSPVKREKASTTAQPMVHNSNNLSTGMMAPLPDYLLTASPGTALSKILSDTSYPDDDRTAHQAQPQKKLGATDLGAFFNSSPEDNNNGKGVTSSSFDQVLSSLSRNFTNRLPSTNITVPSSSANIFKAGTKTPTAPDTSFFQATGASTVKKPSAPPQVINTFHEDDNFGAQQDLRYGTDSIFGGAGGWGLNGTDLTSSFDIAHLLDLPPQPPTAMRRNSYPMASYQQHQALGTSSGDVFSSHLLGTTDPHQPFDFGSLPPSSPPALPSDIFTPSDWGPTPGSIANAADDEHPIRGDTAAVRRNNDATTLDYDINTLLNGHSGNPAANKVDVQPADMAEFQRALSSIQGLDIDTNALTAYFNSLPN